MQLTLENTTKGAISLPGLELEPGENELGPDQIEAWRKLRAVGTSRDLIRKRQPRWPARVATMIANGWIKVVRATGADDRTARREASKAAGAKVARPTTKTAPVASKTSDR